MMTRTLMDALPKDAPRFPLGEGAPAAGAARAVPLAQPPSTQPMPTVQMLVTLAAVDPEVERRRKQSRQAQKGLEQLDALYAELVSGEPSLERLAEIADWATQLETPDDPVLAEITREIELRVRVELAKLDIEV